MLSHPLAWTGPTKGETMATSLNIALFRPLDEDDRSSAWAPRQLAFTSETFLLSFSLPNFHFHAVTAYNILRSRGVPLGKRDYEGQLRTRSPCPNRTLRHTARIDLQLTSGPKPEVRAIASPPDRRDSSVRF